MRKAGGIIAIISGVFGSIFALLILLIGGIADAFDEDATMVLQLGLGWLVFSFSSIVIGSICMFVESRVPGIVLIIVTTAGGIIADYSGIRTSMVAFMFLPAAIGGILTLFGNGSRGQGATTLPRNTEPLRIAIYCANCGQMLSTEHRFCTRCGEATKE